MFDYKKLLVVIQMKHYSDSDNDSDSFVDEDYPNNVREFAHPIGPDMVGDEYTDSDTDSSTSSDSATSSDSDTPIIPIRVIRN